MSAFPESGRSDRQKLGKLGSAFGRGCVKRAVFLGNLASARKFIQFFMSLSEIVVAALKFSALLPMKYFAA